VFATWPQELPREEQQWCCKARSSAIAQAALDSGRMSPEDSMEKKMAGKENGQHSSHFLFLNILFQVAFNCKDGPGPELLAGQSRQSIEKPA
jgi:hypothetical protein